MIPNPERFLPYAREGMEAARAVLVGSRHTAESLWETVDLPGLEEKTRLGPPGVDVERVLARPAGSAPAGRAGGPRRGGSSGRKAGGLGRDPASPRGLARLRRAEGPRVVFVGKLIVSKGVDLLLAAWPLVHRAHPEARLMMVGFGEYRDGLARSFWRRSRRGDLDAAREIAAAGWGLEGGRGGAAADPPAFLGEPPEGYERCLPRRRRPLSFVGRLEHDEVADLLPRQPRRWSCRAPSPRRSAWSRPRPPPAGRCRSRAGHSGLPRSPAVLSRRSAAPTSGA